MLVTQLTGQARLDGYQSVFQSWIRQDSDAALRELDAMAPSPSKDNLMMSLSYMLADVDAEAALRWAGSMSPQDRERILPQILQTVPPPSPDEIRNKGVLPRLQPLIPYQVSQPGNVLRIFERGGRFRRRSAGRRRQWQRRRHRDAEA